MILAGDVGGTKVALALYAFQSGSLHHTAEKRFAAKEYAGLEEIVKVFLAEQRQEGKISAACFGVPGPVRHGVLRLTNLPWTLDSRKLSLDLGIDHVFLINDLEANGYGIPELKAEHIFTLRNFDPSAAVNTHAKQVKAGTGGFITGPSALDGLVTAIKRSHGSTRGIVLAKTMEKFRKVPTISGNVSFSAKYHTVFGRRYRVIRIQDNVPKVVGTIVAKVVAKI